MNEILNEYKEIFLEEAEENIRSLNGTLLHIEKDTHNKKLINDLFRIVHTLKSSAAAVGLNDLSILAHRSEDLVQKIRNDETEINPDIMNILFEIFDIIQAYLENLSGKGEFDYDINNTVKKLDNIINISNKKKVKTEKSREKNKKTSHIDLNQYERSLIEEEIKKGSNIYSINIEIDPREQIKWLRAELLLNKIDKVSEIIKIYPDKEEITSRNFNGIFLVIIASSEDKNRIKKEIIIDLIKNITIKPVSDIDQSFVLEKTEEKKISKEKKSHYETENNTGELGSPSSSNEYHISKTNEIIRVPVRKLDNLMNLVGELIISNSGLKQLEQKVKNKYKIDGLYNEMTPLTEKLFNVSMDLQYNIMNARMLPISNIFEQFHRVVRDISMEEKKEVELILKGSDTELDKNVIDIIGDPLVHLVRNAVDHGIEMPEEREKSGKPKKAEIILSASQVGNHIVISVKDNGNGIDLEKVKKKIIKNGLKKKNEIDSLSSDQILNFIFEPGFSTSEKISNISGRGVGLDVVKNVVKKLNGVIDINTKIGEGTEFVITLPLTLATTSAILAEFHKTIYAVPIADANEVIKVNKKDIETVEGNHVIQLRNKILPLINLQSVFGYEAQNNNEIETIIVLTYQDKQAGIIVDKIIGDQEIVLKPLEKHFTSVKGLSGAAILGDGSIALVIDVLGIISIVKELQDNSSEKINTANSNRIAPLIRKDFTRERKELPPDNNNPYENESIKGEKIFNDLFEKSFKEAATSLSQMTNKNISILRSKVELLSGEDFINKLEDKMEDPYFASVIKTENIAGTNIVFIISKKEGLKLYNSINEEQTKEVSKDVITGIGEINNILGNTFINNLANLIKNKIDPDPPCNLFEMLGAIWQGIILQEEYLNKKILYADTIIRENDKQEFHARLLIISDKEKLFKMIEGV